MKLSKALILLRICRDESIEFLQGFPELGTFNENEDFEISDEQYYMLYKHFSDNWDECKILSDYGYYNDEYNEIIPQKKHISTQEKQIELGLILQCRGNRKYAPESFGVLIGFYGDKLYYFDKEEYFDLPQYQLVSFIVDENDENKALYVTDIDKYEIVGHDNESITKSDGLYFESAGKKAMQRGIPFIALSRNYGCLYFPVQKDHSDLYFMHVLNGTYIEAVNLRLLSKALSLIPNIQVVDVKNKLQNLNKYIKNLAYKNIIKTYRVIENGYLQRRVGRDDHFNIITTRTVESYDTYIKSLFPIGETTKYYATNSYEENYQYIDEETTKKEIEVAINKYDKIEHLAFLLKEYIDGHYEVVHILSELDTKLKQKFNLEKFRSKVKALYFYAYYYKRVVTRYNNESIH